MNRIQAYDIIRAPLVTEKATMASEQNKVLFEVAVDANKKDIKEAIEKLFKVKVEAVNTLRRKGKTKRFRGIKGQRNERKHALITLKEGHSIDVSTGL
ncbi:MAG: 50S ribosomal protein L23 [Parvibaculales bacterium]